MTLPAGARDVRPVGGGDINEAFRVTLADGSDAFVKTRSGAEPGEYAAEAAGLRWLAEPQALRVPRVLDVDHGYLALQWVERGRLEAAGVEELGRGLAETHAAGAGAFGAADRAAGAGPPGDVPPADPGLPAGPVALARLGTVALSNEPAGDWPTFYAQRRLLPLAAMARERGSLSRAGGEAVERLCGRLPDLAGPPEPPARLHGDLWSGNVMPGDDGRPWLIDPSAYGGHREVDLAMLRLFGAPSQRVFAAYEEVWPLADASEERVELYQLLPLLVHAVLFGGGYGAAAERAARRYAG